MAYNESIIRLTGTDQTVTFYKMNGEYHVRNKSSLTGKQFWKLPAFEGSRRSCKRFAEGNKLASHVYRSLPRQQQRYFLFCQLKTLAIRYIKMNLTAEEILVKLQEHTATQQHVIPNKPKVQKPKKPFPFATEITGSYIGLTMGRFWQLDKKYGRETLMAMARSLLFSKPLPQAMQLLKQARA